MPNETSNAEKLIQLQDDIAAAIKKSPDQEALINKNTAPMLASFDDNDFADAAQLRDVRSEAAETEGKSMGGMMQYNMGGSMLVPPEREGYIRAGLVKLLVKTFTKTPTDKQLVKKAKEVHQSVEDLSMEMPKKKAMEQTAKELDMPISSIKRFEEQFAREAGGGKTDSFFDEIKQTYRALTKEGTQGQQAAAEFGGGKETRASRIKGAKFFGTGNVTGALGIGAPLGVAGTTAYNSLTDTESGDNEERINPEDYPVYKKGTESAKSFREAQRKAKKEKADFFEWEGREYNVKEAKNMGGKIKYAEGSMLMPPEMGMPAEQKMPVDTYDNIPPDEMAAAEASQLPDAKIENNYLEYVLDESLDQEDQEYLMSVLEGDERLSSIFDKVMDVAGEFSGEGEVDGPGTGVSDSIPARLSDGEFVVTEKATDQIGSGNLQTMMDDAEQAYDGGYMKKAFGGMVDDIPTDDRKEDEEINSMMIASNQMPSVRPR